MQPTWINIHPPGLEGHRHGECRSPRSGAGPMRSSFGSILEVPPGSTESLGGPRPSSGLGLNSLNTEIEATNEQFHAVSGLYHVLSGCTSTSLSCSHEVPKTSQATLTLSLADCNKELVEQQAPLAGVPKASQEAFEALRGSFGWHWRPRNVNCMRLGAQDPIQDRLE